MNSDRAQKIRRQLELSFAPTELLIKDQSHLHAGHAGAEDGRGHFDVRIVSDAFKGMSRIQRHRAVYKVLDDLIKSDIHALRITALAPDDVHLSGKSP